MKYILVILILLSLVSLVGCVSSKDKAPLPTVSKVDLNRYLGKWYEIARYEHSFEKGCSNVSATYSIRDDGKIKVLNSCLKDGKIKEAIGKAYPVDETNSKLKVSFFGPFYGDYWIIMLDDDYSYAVIGEASRDYFWILSRTNKLDKATIDMILKRVVSLGYDTQKIIWTPQD